MPTYHFFRKEENYMLQADLHTHSIASGHGDSITINAMARKASEKGIRLLGISDHGPATPGAAKLSYFRSLKNAPRTRESIALRYGAEANILSYQGDLDIPDDILSTLDYVIVSIHRSLLTPGSIQENTNAYLAAMEHPNVRIIGHCDDARYQIDYRELVSAARKRNILPEINNTSLLPQQYRGDTRDNLRNILTCCRSMDYPVLLSSDSHSLADVGNVSLAKDFLDTEQFPSELILNHSAHSCLSWLDRSV